MGGPTNSQCEDRQLAMDRLHTATELLRGWVWETDTEHRVTYLSEGSQRFTGRPAEWHYGKTRQELGYAPWNGPSDVDVLKQLERLEPFGPIEYHRAHEGKAIWYRTLGAPVFSPQGIFTGYRGIAYDVTNEVMERDRRKLAEKALQAAHDMLSATIEVVPVALSIFDSDGRLAYANARFYEMSDLPINKFPIGMKLSDMVEFLSRRGEFKGPDTDQLVRDHMSAVDNGTPHRYQRTRPNGKRIEITGVPLPGGGAVRTYVDITHLMELNWRLEAKASEVAMTKAQLHDITEKFLEVRKRLRVAEAG